MRMKQTAAPETPSLRMSAPEAEAEAEDLQALIEAYEPT